MKSRLGFLLFLVVFSTVKSQMLYNLNVEELFRLGIENSTKIKASQIKSEISETHEALAKIDRLPLINLNLANGYVGKPSIYDTDFSYLKKSNIPDWKQSYGVEVNQLIYQGGKIRNTIKNASIEKEISYLNLEKDKADIKLILVNNYLELLRLYKQKEVLEENIAEAEKRLHDVENLKKEGIVTNNDVLRSQIIVSNYELSLKQTEDDIAIISQQLDIVLGLDEKYIIVPDSMILGKEILVESEENYIQQSYENYPELKISDYGIEKARVNKKIIKSKYLPSVTLNMGNNLNRPIPNLVPSQDLYINTWGITLGLSYKISSWFDHKHAVNEVDYAIDLQENQKEQAKENIRINIKYALTKHQEAKERVKVLNKVVEQAKENYRITYNKYFNQLAILTDLLDASSIQLDAELQLITAKANFIYTYYQLLKVSGKL